MRDKLGFAERDKTASQSLRKVFASENRITELYMPESVLKDKSKEFAKNIVYLCRRLKIAGVEQILLNQLLKSGTSIGSNIHEAQYAQGSKDFVSKLEIALKEANESDFWLGLLFDTESIEKSEYEKFIKDEAELRRMLVSSITTIKSREES